MIPKECKRIAEVDFPVAEVSKQAMREQHIRRGHPSALHKWWARRPLASSRAVLLALLLPDPRDALCPDAFKAEARRVLLGMHGAQAIATDTGLQGIILKFIADFSNYDHAMDQAYLDVSRALVKAAHGSEPPLVLDPFAGGGSIPLEALRLGCEAFASDLNPVACLILKVMLEDAPRYGPELEAELHEAGCEIGKQADRTLADMYPQDEDGATPTAYLWARVVRCEAPNCGAEIPLMHSFWLCNKAKRKCALRPRVVRPKGEQPHVEFDVFEPKVDVDVRDGTVKRAKAACLCCGAKLPPERVRSQLADQRGGGDVVFDAEGTRTGGARMTAVVTLKPGQTKRCYRLPTDADYAPVRRSQARLAEILDEWKHGGKQGLCPVPDEPLPPIGTLGFRVQRYGMTQWGDLFTARQKMGLLGLGRSAHSHLAQSDTHLDAIVPMCIDAVVMRNCTGCRWQAGGEHLFDAFGLQALPIVWDFAENNPAREFKVQIQRVAKSLRQPLKHLGTVQQSDATNHPLPDQTVDIWFTDPPYYNAIPYADLSDFFFVWLKRMIPNHLFLRDPSDPDNRLSPKTDEVVQDQTKRINGRPKDREWFEEKIAKAFTEGRRVLGEDGVGAVVFAHKSTEGWEALLSGMIRGGWTITGSWPIATEVPGRLRAQNSATLATSVHLICRPRPDNAVVGDWAEVLSALTNRVSTWMKRLQNEGIRGADLVFACIGPALEIFSRFRAVETVEGDEVDLRDYLGKVWAAVGCAALEQVLVSADVAGALEEDARLTALFLWTLHGTALSEDNDNKTADDDATVAKATAKGLSLPFDVVRRFAQPMGIDIDFWTGRIVGKEKGIVRLLPVADRARDLFGEDGARPVADWIEADPDVALQQTLFPETDTVPELVIRKRRKKIILDGDVASRFLNATTLDRVHVAMLLQASGYASALRALIGAEQDRGTEFLTLADALSALYPRGSQEKRLLDAMLLAIPRRS